MAQLHFYVPDDVAAEIRRRAETAGTSTSKFVADLVTREVKGDWPPGFFEEVVGSWEGERPTRPDQGEFEKRRRL
jgi:hypothetical protein